jgi:hypothetical protein
VTEAVEACVAVIEKNVNDGAYEVDSSKGGT